VKTRLHALLPQYRCVPEPCRKALLRCAGRGRIKVAERLRGREFSHGLQEFCNSELTSSPSEGLGLSGAGQTPPYNHVTIGLSFSMT
jgi:hypothetical protein